MRLPNTVYIGLQKTGSTFLRSYFSQHPRIAWTRHGTMFQLDPFVKGEYLARFGADQDCDSLVDMYESIAAGYSLGATRCWDASVALVPGATIDCTAMIPGQREAAKRIEETLPEARIVVTLRNQVDWLRSNYLHYMLDMPAPRRSFAAFLQTREGKLLLAAAAYDQWLMIYRDLFGPKRVHVILLEDVVADEANVLRELCVFLGVDYVPFDPKGRETNTGIGAGRGALVRAYSALGISDAAARRLRPWFRPLERVAARWLKLPALTADEEAMIRATFAVSNFHLSRMLGRDLTPLGYTS